jgi:hypothetical protein
MHHHDINNLLFLFTVFVSQKNYNNINNNKQKRTLQKSDSLDVGDTKPLDNSAQKHKIAIKPKKRHSSSAHRSISLKKQTAQPGER